MIPKINRTSARNRRRSGTTILELALMILPTFSIIFGFLDVGLAIFTWNTLQNAAREGTRYAITYQTVSGYGQRDSIKQKTASWALGFVNANSTSTSGTNVPWVDVKFYHPQTGALVTDPAQQNESGNVVEVSIRNYPYRWMVPFSSAFVGPFYQAPGTNLNVNVYSADVLGGFGLTRPAI
jgi:Flp pilus assembly protein TadG